MAHPVGSYYWSSTNTNPHNLFGGTWIQVKDKFVIAVGDSHEAGKSYGSNTKNLSHSHTTGNHTLTVAEMPGHTHKYARAPIYYAENKSGGTVAGSLTSTYEKPDTSTESVGGSGAHNHGNTGSSLSTVFDITPACEAAYCWKRTA